MLAILASVTTAEAIAQSRPLVTQDPEPVGPGQMLVDLGVDYSVHAFYPLSGLHGNLVRVATFDMSFGVSSVAEIQIGGGAYNRLFITSRGPGPYSDLVALIGSSTGDAEDAVIGAKVRLLSEVAGRPSLAARFFTRLPNAKHASGIGLDTMDFGLSLMSAKTLNALRVVGNVGWSILEDPVKIGIQNDCLTYGGSLARKIGSRAQAEIVGEINGRWATRHGTAPVGTESRSMARLGARITHGAFRYDAAVFLGLTRHDPNWGITGGFTWVFTAFKIP